MNIDRDDEYATRYEAAPTIEEQIAGVRYLANTDSALGNEYWSSVLASLEKLAALEKPVPVEPGFLPVMRKLAAKNLSGSEDAILIRYIDSLQSALKLAQEERDIEAANGKHWAEAYRKWANTDQTRKELLFAIERAEKAESLNRRMVELMKEPSEAMIQAGADRWKSDGTFTDIFKAMSAELLKEAGE